MPFFSGQSLLLSTTVLNDNHDVFALTEGERGETDLLQMKIDTGNALFKYLPAHCTPFAVREEIARQLNQMQQQEVISPSSSPWASPVVLVCKKDGSLCFCIDFRTSMLLPNQMYFYFLT